MKAIVARVFLRYARLVLIGGLVGLPGCDTSTPMAVIVPDPTTTIPPTIAGVQTVASDQAEIVVKAGAEFGEADWRLTLIDGSGKLVGLSAGSVKPLSFFTLTPYRATGLVSGQAYTLRFATRNAGGDSVRVDRSYTHRLTGPRWVQRMHVPVVGGDFAAGAMSTDNVAGLGNYSLSVWQLKRDDTWQSLTFYVENNGWGTDTLRFPIRHGLVRFTLQSVKGVFYPITGLGFVTNELLPGQRRYQKEMKEFRDGRFIKPDFAGPDGEVRWFTTVDHAYQLVEGGPSQVWVRMGSWDQYRTADLPEPTGTLAAFRIGTTGYVLNQRPGQPAHVWAFDTEREQWSRKADFPGAIRSRGIGFQQGGKGYFGLGLTANQETLRDVWQYEPTTDRWQYVTDYPGAGSTYLVVGQLPGHTYLGMGYEHQPTGAGGIRLVGCTDFWEFIGN